MRSSPTCTLTTIGADALELPTLEVAMVSDRVAESPAGSAAASPPLGAGPARLRASLSLDPVIVGTSDEADIVVADRRVSRKHCSFALTERGIVLTDLGSKNGTFV